ncbi:ferrous iron transport protein B, partial [bacterium]
MKYKIALAGNPNSGKTTVFNLLCGTKERIGNWAGTTVEKKTGYFSYEDAEITVVDLPGTYSLSAYSIDEKIARDFLIKEKPDLVVTVIDASNLERNLYLVAQLLELAQPVLLDLNMIDIAKSRGMKIDIEKLSKVLKIDIVATIASKGRGTERLKSKIKTNLVRTDHGPLKINYGKYIESAIERISETISRTGVDMGLPPRSIAVLLLEEDGEIIEMVKRYGILDEIEQIKEETSKEVFSHYQDDVESIIIEKRYGLLKGIKKECVSEERTLEDKLTMSDKIDKVFTNRILGIPLFLFFMFILFQLVFTIGTPLSNLIGDLFAWLGTSSKHLFISMNLPKWIASLISDGIIGGVGSVLVFLPNIVLLFLGISFLEDSGYLTRAAFVMDRFMHALGLHGKSFIPLLLGFGCNIPAIMSTRILESRKDRILTILVNPLMSCSARLTVY